VVFVAGEAEVDEPLAVEGAGHRLQNLDAPLAVLDQLVVGRQDARDALLDGERGSSLTSSSRPIRWAPAQMRDGEDKDLR
jgi:hypothetical protein